MILPHLVLVVAGAIVALPGAFGHDTYFNVRRPSDIPFYRRMCVVIGFILILIGLVFPRHRH